MTSIHLATYPPSSQTRLHACTTNERQEIEVSRGPITGRETDIIENMSFSADNYGLSEKRSLSAIFRGKYD